nr:hypothetical protein [uncultured Desulfobacter sp.]
MGSTSNNHELDIAKTVYTNMRSEIIEKMKFSNQLLLYKLASIGSILGSLFALRNPDLGIFSVTAAFLGVGVALSFDLAVYQNNKAIIVLGCFMKDHVEIWLKSICDRQDVVMWEEFIARDSLPEISKNRMVYNFFESSNYLLTLILMIVGIVIVWQYEPWLIVSLFPFLLGEIILTYKGIDR